MQRALHRHSRNPAVLTRRRFVQGATAAGAIVALGRSTVAAQQPVEIQFMSWPNPEDHKRNEALVAEFERLNPTIRVKLLPQLDAYEEKMLAMYAAGTPPDCFQLSSNLYRAYADQGLLEDLGPYIERDREEIQWDDIFDNLRAAYQLDGTWFGYPFGGDTEVIYYNRDLFRAKGVPDPNEQAARGEWTWDALLNAARTLHEVEAGDQVRVWGLATIGYWQVYPIAAGGELFNDDMTACVLDSPEAIRGVQFYADLVTEHRVMPAATERLGMGSRGYLGAFTSQRAAMYAHGIWEAADVREQATGFEWDIAPEAVGPSGQKVAYSPPGSLCLASAERGGRNVEAAWEWVKFLLSPENAKKGALEQGGVPSYKSLAADPEIRAAIARVVPPDHILVNVEQAQYAHVRELLPEGAAKFYDIQAAEFDRMLAGEIDAATAARRIVEQTNPLLES